MDRRRVLVAVNHAFGFGRGVLRGVAAYSREVGDWQITLRLGLAGVTPEEVRRTGCEGVIASVRSPGEVDCLIATGLPVVNVTSRYHHPEMAHVIGDDREFGRLVGEHFLDRGFERLAFLMRSDTAFQQRRFEAFAQTADSAGVPCEKLSDVADLQTDWPGNDDEPLGLMVATDHDGVLAIEACRNAGLRVPEDCAVVGVDNDEIICELCNPPLSSVDRNLDRHGFRAGELMQALLEGAPLPEEPVLIPARGIVQRRSSEFLAIRDEEVRTAMRFIAANRHVNIGVDHVVAATALSRRGLQYRFKRVLGRTISGQILRTRIEAVKELLTASEMTLEQIARRCDYGSFVSLARAFKRAEGISPGRYRKLHRHIG
jgi:LacI family transcriptional regulator